MHPMLSNAMAKERTLPDYDQPPVVETVLGLEFPPVQGWDVPHFGLLWSKFRTDYPNFEVQPRLAGQFDVSIGVEAPALPAGAKFTKGVPVRCWFFSEDRTRLIQVQNDRFMHNWIKTGSAESYPHYEKIRPRFERDWNRFLQFLDEEGIQRPGTVRWEVTYVNHLEKDVTWNSFADLPKVISSWSGKGSTGFLPSADAVVLNIRYPIADAKASLNVSIEPAQRRSDSKEVLQIRLTAQGEPANASTDSILQSLDIGRSWIVNGFTDLTTSSMHQLWKRRI